VSWLAFFTLSIVSYGCDGGGNSTQEAAPEVRAIVEGELVPGATVMLTATADDGDHELRFRWQQTGGPAVTLEESDRARSHFRIPPVGEDTEFGFEVTATDMASGTGSYTFHFTVPALTWKQLHIVESDATEQFVVFLADKDLNNRTELYRANLDGTGIVLLNTPLVAGGNVVHFEISLDQQYVAYLADEDNDEVFELFVTDSDGGEVRKISALATAGGDVTSDFIWAPDSSRIAYRADQRSDEVFELFTNMPDGSDNTHVSGDMAVGGNVIFENFAWSPDGERIAYRANQFTEGVLELFTSDASGTDNVRVSAPQVAGGGVLGNFAWAPNGEHVAYVADQRAVDVFELFVVGPDGADNRRVSGPLVTDGSVLDFAWAPNS
jgi:hypothetical protein